MHNLFFFLMLAISLSAFSMQPAEAASKYEKIKIMYGQASAPNSESELFARAVQVKDCAEFASSNPDQSTPESLVVVSHTIGGGGPEFPDQFLRGLGFGNAGIDPEQFFRNYKSQLSTSGFSLQYNYQYFESICYDYPDGSSYCSGGYHVTVDADAQFRVSKDYLIYKRAPDIYGYCWRRD